jgi:hypothetical protein
MSFTLPGKKICPLRRFRQSEKQNYSLLTAIRIFTENNMYWALLYKKEVGRQNSDPLF